MVPAAGFDRGDSSSDSESGKSGESGAAAAAERLVRMPGLPARTRAGLRRLLVNLADVTRLPRGHSSPEIPIDRLNRRYEAALRLARLALAGRSFDQPPAGSASRVTPMTGRFGMGGC